MYGKRLKELRKQRGWTIDIAADKLQISRSTYAGYETEHRKPPIETIAWIAKFYNVSADYILGLVDEPNIKELEYNAYEYLQKGDLHWNGKILSDEDLKPIRDLLEIVVRDRLPERVEKIKKKDFFKKKESL
jgi:transcriptional regulator with XRE-family HTH domain